MHLYVKITHAITREYEGPLVLKESDIDSAVDPYVYPNRVLIKMYHLAGCDPECVETAIIHALAIDLTSIKLPAGKIVSAHLSVPKLCTTTQKYLKDEDILFHFITHVEIPLKAF